MPALPLRDATLPRLPGTVRVPAYDRAALTPSVVHLSVGSFHRAHQAVYLDDLAARGHTGWGLVGVGLRRRTMRDVLSRQDGLYTVLERGAGGDTARVVGVLRRYLYGPDHGRGVVEAMADPRVRLLTLTITGAAYDVDPHTGAFLAADPDVRADLATPGTPRSALGHVVAMLALRRRRGLGGVTILSCDNMPGNGAVARAAVVGFAAAHDLELARWIEEHVRFPSSMVDRITPGTTDADRALLAHDFGVDDAWPVVTEPFSEWVVEDDFGPDRPPLEEAGVQLVPCVRPHALRKTRLLNAAHCALGYLGTLAGHTSTDEAVGDPVLRGYVTRLMADDVSPLLPRLPGFDLAAYRVTLLERLANPVIGDRLARLCRNGSTKMPTHVLSSIAEARAAGRPHRHLTLAVAGWILHLRGHGGVPVDDPHAARLIAAARGDLRALVGGDEALVAEVATAVRALEEHGVHAAVTAGHEAPLAA